MVNIYKYQQGCSRPDNLPEARLYLNEQKAKRGLLFAELGLTLRTALAIISVHKKNPSDETAEAIRSKIQDAQGLSSCIAIQDSNIKSLQDARDKYQYPFGKEPQQGE